MFWVVSSIQLSVNITDILEWCFKSKIKSSKFNIYIGCLLNNSFPTKLILLIHSLKSLNWLIGLQTIGDSNFLRFNKVATLPSHSYYLNFNIPEFCGLENSLIRLLKFPMNISFQSLKLLRILSFLY